MFWRGMDPDVEDPNKCHSCSEIKDTWPSVKEINAYKERVRDEFLMELSNLKDNTNYALFDMAYEHESMHQETLFYMILQRPSLPSNTLHISARIKQEPKKKVYIPEGLALMGQRPGEFGWDNEFPQQQVHVKGFWMDNLNVTVGEFLTFVEEGHYENPEYWTTDNWKWKESNNLKKPIGWKKIGGEYVIQTFKGIVPIHNAREWPVSVSYAEASAYAKWKGGYIASESQYQRAAYSNPEGGFESYPWGDEAPIAGKHGNFGWNMFYFSNVGTHPEGKSKWGIHDMIGDAWEWTSTPFSGLKGFKEGTHYVGYSTDFFDGKHMTMKGASYCTDISLIRPSFRNWYQGKYLYMIAKFRLSYDHI